MSESSIIQSGLVFCVACGNQLIDTAVVCPKCGTPRAILPNVHPNVTKIGKSKTAAVLLAVFLGFWSWAYSYKRDKGKFWFALGTSVAIAVGVGIYVSFKYENYHSWNYDSQMPFSEFYARQSFYDHVSSFLAVAWLIQLGWHVAAIVSAARKPSRF
jgi:hypothetical protein